MGIADYLNLTAVACGASGTICLGLGFWPSGTKITITKDKEMRGGKVTHESPAYFIDEGVSDSEVPEEVRTILNNNELLIYKGLLKKGKDLENIKHWGRVGTFLVLLGFILAAFALFIPKA